MIFTTPVFFIFFPAVFLVYWSLHANEWRKAWLLLASMVFYAAWDWRFLGLVGLVIINSYLTPLLIVRYGNPAWRKCILACGITFSLGLLGYFKYFNFFRESFSALFHVQSVVMDIILPIGISFYTFHSISYMVDTYRGKIIPTSNAVTVALYILFFPQLVAGPIVRATDLMPQLQTAPSYASVNFKYLLLLFLVGYFKKAVIADNLSPLIDSFFAHPDQYKSVDGLFAVFFYTVQIYCDFSGYTDMAIAVAGMLGYHLKPNFAHPYFSSSLIEFWRHWHISLSSWFRDYVYIPLGGNHGGGKGQARNILVTMLLAGLWHGASWTFVLWGGLHALGLIICHLWQQFRGTSGSQKYSLAGNVLTIVYVAFLWIFFRASSFSNLAMVFNSFGHWGEPVLYSAPRAFIVAMLLILAHLLCYRFPLERWSIKDNRIFAFSYGVAVACIMPCVSVDIHPFIYFKF